MQVSLFLWKEKWVLKAGRELEILGAKRVGENNKNKTKVESVQLEKTLEFILRVKLLVQYFKLRHDFLAEKCCEENVLAYRFTVSNIVQPAKILVTKSK